MMATPFTTPVELTGLGSGHPFTVTSSMVVDPGLPLFAGHYPGFPIFPGVCLIEVVHQTVLRAAQQRGQRVVMAGVRSTRFIAPAFPADELTSKVEIGGPENRWDCRATLHNGDALIARVRLDYRTEDPA